MKSKYLTPFKWTNCQLCGLFRECDEIIAPEWTWKIISPEKLLTTKRYVCFNCKKIEFYRIGYHGLQDLLYESFPELHSKVCENYEAGAE